MRHKKILFLPFFFGIAVTVGLFIYLEHTESDDETTKLTTAKKKFRYSLVSDGLLIITSIFLLFSGLLQIQNDILLIPTLAMSAFGCGYCLLNLSRATSYFSKLELLVLSFIVSILVTGLLFFVGIWIPTFCIKISLFALPCQPFKLAHFFTSPLPLSSAGNIEGMLPLR
jgi:hypothetical protein